MLLNISPVTVGSFLQSFSDTLSVNIALTLRATATADVLQLSAGTIYWSIFKTLKSKCDIFNNLFTNPNT